MSDISELLLKDQLQLYRLQRHDFLNHFQVIMGYLQLGNPEKAMNYIREALKGLEGEQKISQIPEAYVSSILLGWVVELKNRGAIVSLELDKDISKNEYWEKKWKQEYVMEFYGYTRKCLEVIEPQNEKILRAVIRLYDSNQSLNCSFTLQDELSVLAQEIWRN